MCDADSSFPQFAYGQTNTVTKYQNADHAKVSAPTTPLSIWTSLALVDLARPKIVAEITLETCYGGACHCARDL
jgi:hypothetical protein